MNGRATATRRVAVLGTYSSGSTAVAGCLHHLGVCMGRRFYRDFYEPEWLSEQLRQWWNEPHLVERSSAQERVDLLKAWIEDMERDTPGSVGAKHPLLSLCGPDLLAAWGQQTRFIWTTRPLEKAIHSLAKRNWWTHPESIQQRLWTAVTQFFQAQAHLQIEFAAMMNDPRTEVLRLVEYLELQPTPEQFDAAIASVQPTSRE